MIYPINNELIVLMNISLTLFLFYFLVAFFLFFLKDSETKILNIIRDPKRASRGRKNVDEYIEKSKNQKKLFWIWPYLLFQVILSYVKERFKKEQK